MKPVDLQKNKNEYYVYGFPVNYARYGINGPNPVITQPYPKKLRQYAI